VFATIDALRIPIDYLANLFTAGKAGPVRAALRKLTAIRALMRAAQLGLPPEDNLASSVDAQEADLEDLYRLLAIAKYDDRYVIPEAHAEDAGRLQSQHEQLFCSLDTDGGPGMGGAGPQDIAGFHPPEHVGDTRTFRADDGRVHFNLLGWNGTGPAPRLFPDGGTA
jgi:nitrate reductase beta subunit